MSKLTYILTATLFSAGISPAIAQRSDDNAIAQADDAFGTSVGNENIGVYSPYEVRGFSAIDAGNARIDGLYFDQQIEPTSHIVDGSTIRVGISAQGYPLPAPTGIVDYSFRRAGAKPLLSVFAGLGPYSNQLLEVDYQTTLVPDHLSIVGGVTGERSNSGNGAFGNYASVGIAPRWTPTADVEIIPFASLAWSWEQEAFPLIFVDGPHLPQQIDRRVDYGQKWTDNRAFSSNIGVLGRADIGGFELRAGLFHSRFLAQDSFADLYLDVDTENVGDHLIIADQNQEFASLSGEVRLSRKFVIGGNPHTFYLIGRGRDQRRRYGGSDILEFGRATVGVPVTLPQPALSFGEQTRDRVGQITVAAAYNGRPLDWLEVSAGLQRANYQKKTYEPGAVEPVRGEDRPWLYNGTAAANLSSRLAIYASYTRGLEEGGVAPQNAVNKGAAAPALITRQIDAGFRYAINDKLRLVAGVFDVSKPYFNLDQANVYRSLGSFRQRGLEMSLTGSLAKGLNIVAGTVLVQPRVRGEEVDSGRIGRVPVGQTGRITILSADYQIPKADGLSANATLASVGKRAASRDNQLFIPARSVLDVGLRQRLKIGQAPATLSVRVGNVFNNFGWRTNSSGVFQPNDRRRLSVTIAADF